MEQRTAATHPGGQAVAASPPRALHEHGGGHVCRALRAGDVGVVKLLQLQRRALRQHLPEQQRAKGVTNAMLVGSNVVMTDPDPGPRVSCRHRQPWRDGRRRREGERSSRRWHMAKTTKIGTAVAVVSLLFVAAVWLPCFDSVFFFFFLYAEADE